MSSTDSDMTKAIHAANKEVLDSPPNLISPKGSNQPDGLLTVVEQQEPKTEHALLADHITDLLLT